MTQTSPPPTAFFDYDGTLIEGDSILFWQRHYYSQRPWRRIFQLTNAAGLALAGLKVIDSHTLKRIFLWPLAFETRESLDALGRDFVRTDLSTRFHGPVVARLWAHHRMGHAIVVISASCTFYLKHLKELLPPDCTILGTEIEWKSGFLRIPEYRGGNLRGSNKIRRLRDLGYAAAGKGGFAYSDHPHDIPLLEFVDHPACIRPTQRLAQAAMQRGWPVWEWPRKRAAWKVKAEAGCLLLFAWAPKFLAAPPELPRPNEVEIEEQLTGIAAKIGRVSL